jgi:hypothetical protein
MQWMGAMGGTVPVLMRLCYELLIDCAMSY